MDEKAPREVDFDTILDELRKEDKDTACVFNCQVLCYILIILTFSF